jgi:hypothetical protein
MYTFYTQSTVVVHTEHCSYSANSVTCDCWGMHSAVATIAVYAMLYTLYVILLLVYTIGYDKSILFAQCAANAICVTAAAATTATAIVTTAASAAAATASAETTAAITAASTAAAAFCYCCCCYESPTAAARFSKSSSTAAAISLTAPAEHCSTIGASLLFVLLLLITAITCVHQFSIPIQHKIIRLYY